MSINPLNGKKCWSCKYCEDIGYESEYDSVYHRKCNHPSKEYIGKCERYCSYYVFDGKYPEFDFTERSTSSSPSSSSTSSYDADDGNRFVAWFFGIAIVIGLLVKFSPMLVDFFEKKEAEAPNDTYVSGEFADNAEVKTALVIADPAMNIRSGPSTEHEVVGGAAKGETVKVEKIENGWAYVEYNGIKGWCSADLISIQ